MPGLGAIARWAAERRRNPPPPDPHPWNLPRRTPDFDPLRASPEGLTVTWVGHSTVLLQLGGMNVLTDPVWSRRASPVGFAGPRRWIEPGVALRALPPLDLVLVSHNHYDHLDAGTVRRLAAAHTGARWLVPLGLGRTLRRFGVLRVDELDWWDERRVGELSIGCTPARHFSSRHFFDRDRTLWCGWTVAAGDRRVFFAGDTGYHPEFGAIGARFGPFDLSLMPVGAYAPRWVMEGVHLNPEEAVRAFADLQGGPPGGVMVPIHWGTFKLTDEPMDEPPRRTRAAWAAAGLPAEDLWLPALGETRRL